MTFAFGYSPNNSKRCGYVAAQTILQYWKYGYSRAKYNVRNEHFSMNYTYCF